MLFLIGNQVKRLLRNREIIFWTLAFPIILGTLFNMAFGSFMKDNEIKKVFPIAVVEESTVEQNLKNLIGELGKKGDNQLYSIQNVNNEEKAKELLNNKKIDGYYVLAKEPKLVVAKNGMNQSIMKEVLDKYKRTVKVTTDVISVNPTIVQDQQKLQELVKSIAHDEEYTKETPLGKGEADSMLNYFYALIGMACIYGSLLGVNIVLALEGNQSPLGARRNVSPTHKLKILCADTIGSILVHIASVFIVLAYLVLALKVDFGSNIGFVMLASSVGCVIGVCMGVFLGAVVKGGEALKVSFALSVSMAFSFLSGLMVNTMPHIIEKSCPILNRINPCVLLNNCFFSLNVYGDFTEYWKNFLGMLIISAIFILGAFLLLRRRKYASI